MELIYDNGPSMRFLYTTNSIAIIRITHNCMHLSLWIDLNREFCCCCWTYKYLFLFDPLIFQCKPTVWCLKIEIIIFIRCEYWSTIPTTTHTQNAQLLELTYLFTIIFFSLIYGIIVTATATIASSIQCFAVVLLIFFVVVGAIQ